MAGCGVTGVGAEKVGLGAITGLFDVTGGVGFAAPCVGVKLGMAG